MQRLVQIAGLYRESTALIKNQKSAKTANDVKMRENEQRAETNQRLQNDLESTRDELKSLQSTKRLKSVTYNDELVIESNALYGQIINGLGDVDKCKYINSNHECEFRVQLQESVCKKVSDEKRHHAVKIDHVPNGIEPSAGPVHFNKKCELYQPGGNMSMESCLRIAQNCKLKCSDEKCESRNRNEKQIHNVVYSNTEKKCRTLIGSDLINPSTANVWWNVSDYKSANLVYNTENADKQQCQNMCVGEGKRYFAVGKTGGTHINDSIKNTCVCMDETTFNNQSTCEYSDKEDDMAFQESQPTRELEIMYTCGVSPETYSAVVQYHPKKSSGIFSIKTTCPV